MAFLFNQLSKATNWLAPFGLAFLLSACSEPSNLQVAKGSVAGLSFQVSYAPVSSGQTEARVNQQVYGLVAHLEQQFSLQAANSDLIRINQWQDTEGMLLTRELEEYVRAGLAIDQWTENNLPLFMYQDQPLTRDERRAWLKEGVRAPLIWVHNHHLFKRKADFGLNYDLLLAGFIADRVEILMGQMGIQFYHIEVAEQNLYSRAYIKQKNLIDAELKPTFKRPALGYVPCELHDECYVYTLAGHAIEALAFAHWMAELTIQDALATAERLNVPLLIEIHEKNSIQRYTSRTYL